MSESTPPARDQIQGAIVPDLVAWPLTCDEHDASGANTLARTGGPRITPDGFRANGFDARYTLTTLPAWLQHAGAPVSLHAIARVDAPARSSRDVVVSLCSTSADQPKIEIAVVPDPAVSAVGCVALRAYKASSVVVKHLNRLGWRFEFRAPELVDGAVPAFQGLLWLDASTLLLVGHLSNLKTLLYRVDAATGEYTGRGSSTDLRHMGPLALDSAGNVWASDLHSYGNGYATFRIDLGTSFSTGEIAVVPGSMSPHGDFYAVGGVAFVEVGGTEYVLLQEYDSTGSPWLYVFPASALGASLAQANRHKRFSLGYRVQDICMRASDGLLYASRNIDHANTDTRGWVQSYDIASAIASAADGSTLTPLAGEPAATRYAEGIDFHPVTDRLWMNTEGLSVAVVDQRSHVAVWSSAFPQEPEENVYLVDFQGGSLEVRLNGRLMVDMAGHTPATAPTRIAVGGPPSATAGLASGFMVAGTVRALAVKSQPFTQVELDDLASGALEPGVLTESALALTNPGAEAGSSSGWTDELAGTTGVRQTSPVPTSGSWYFVGGNAASSRARQHVSLPAGLTDPWVVVEWLQASYDGSTDPGGVGVRALDAGGTELGYFPSPEISVTPSQTWVRRSWSASLPAGTTQVDIVQHRTRTSGTNVDCYVDDIRATVFSL